MSWLSMVPGLAKALITTRFSYAAFKHHSAAIRMKTVEAFPYISPKNWRREDLEQESIELIWAEVYLSPSKRNRRPLLLGCCYRPPNACTLFYEHLENILDKVAERDILLLGDWSAKHRDWFIGDTTNYHGTTLKGLTERFHMSQLCCEPTHLMNDGKLNSLLDISCLY